MSEKCSQFAFHLRTITETQAVAKRQELQERAAELLECAAAALRSRQAQWVERLMCEAIVATQDGSSGRMVCDVERLLHYFNSHKPDAAMSQQEGK